jgi:hypothetical protein
MGDREKAEAQFEYVIENYPLQRAPALKSVKMLQNIHAGIVKEGKPPKQPPFVVAVFPELYSADADPNIRTIKIVFSEPMKKTDWFYSSFPKTLLPQSNGLPSFDPCGLEWTLPVRLQLGKIYAIAVNYGSTEKNMKGISAGFCSVAGLRCEKFVLVFATADEEQQPMLIDDKIIEECDKINFKP